MEQQYDYDLLVIGSGPAGKRAAIQGAKLDKRVAVVERTTVLGGYQRQYRHDPSKTLREAVLELSGYRSREFYGASYTVKQNITMQDLLVRTNKVIQHEIDVTRHQLMRNGVELIPATAAFCGPAHAAPRPYRRHHRARPSPGAISLSPVAPKRPATATSRSTAATFSPATTS